MSSLVVSNDSIYEITDISKKDATTLTSITGTPIGRANGKKVNLFELGFRAATSADLINHLVKSKKSETQTWFASVLGVDKQSSVSAKVVVPSTDIYPCLRALVNIWFNHRSNTYEYSLSAYSMAPELNHDYTLDEGDTKKAEGVISSFVKSYNSLCELSELPISTLKLVDSGES